MSAGGPGAAPDEHAMSDAEAGAGPRRGEPGPGRPGRVVLVGAGPGDPELITLRGAAWLRIADAVVYDALAAPELLALAPPGAERINVGKRGHEEPTLSQADTSALLVRLAREGRTVVRLKGGDPFVFGRGGEEASACAEAGIPFEVVPGVSAAVAVPAYAGIPVTDRRHAGAFTVVTGHKDPEEPAAAIRWAEIARSGDTLVILMGLRRLAAIAEQLVALGRPAETPAAAIARGTTRAQRVVEAPLGELAARVAEAGLEGPTTIVVGEVVALRRQLAWAERLPLLGWRVLVTRSEEQAGGLAAALRRAGAEPVLAPMIRIQPIVPAPGLEAALAQLDRYDAILLTSANAARIFAERARERGAEPGAVRARVLCVGPASAEAARAAGFSVHAMPAGRYDAEGLLAEVARALPPRGRRFLLPGAAAGRETLAAGLRSAGAEVDAVPIYRTEPAAADAEALRARLAAGGLDALTFTSPSTVKHFVAILDDASRAAASRCVVAAIGPVTAAALREAGLPPDLVAESAGHEALVAGLAERAIGSGPRPGEPGRQEGAS